MVVLLMGVLVWKCINTLDMRNPCDILFCRGKSQKGGCMRGLISMFLSLLFSVGMLNPVLAADRVVVCEEFYQEF